MAGLYAVLWGKAEELKRINKLVPSMSTVEDHKEAETMTCSKKIEGGHKEIEEEGVENGRNTDDGSVVIEIETLHKEIVRN